MLAGKHLREEPFTDDERRQLNGFASAFPDLQNPVHIHCTVPEHRVWGAVVFPDEIIAGAVVGNIRVDANRLICRHCGDESKWLQNQSTCLGASHRYTGRRANDCRINCKAASHGDEDGGTPPAPGREWSCGRRAAQRAWMTPGRR